MLAPSQSQSQASTAVYSRIVMTASSPCCCCSPMLNRRCIYFIYFYVSFCFNLHHHLPRSCICMPHDVSFMTCCTDMPSTMVAVLRFSCHHSRAKIAIKTKYLLPEELAHACGILALWLPLICVPLLFLLLFLSFVICAFCWLLKILFHSKFTAPTLLSLTMSMQQSLCSTLVAWRIPTASRHILVRPELVAVVNRGRRWAVHTFLALMGAKFHKWVGVTFLRSTSFGFSITSAINHQLGKALGRGRDICIFEGMAKSQAKFTKYKFLLNSLVGTKHYLCSKFFI